MRNVLDHSHADDGIERPERSNQTVLIRAVGLDDANPGGSHEVRISVQRSLVGAVSVDHCDLETEPSERDRKLTKKRSDFEHRAARQPAPAQLLDQVGHASDALAQKRREVLPAKVAVM